MREICAARVDKVDTRQLATLSYLLCSKVLFHGERIIGAAFDRRIVGNHHALNSFDYADASHDTRAWDGLIVHLPSGELTNFKEVATIIEQM